MSKKKNKKKKQSKSLIKKLIIKNKEKRINPFLLAVEFLGAFIVDTLRIIKNILLTLLKIGIVCGIIAGIFLIYKLEPYYTKYNTMANEIVDNSKYSDFKLDQSSYIYDSNKKVIAKLQASQESYYLTFDEIPDEVVDAFVAVEDRTFWDNPGIDIKGIIRILYNFVKSSGQEAHGASTITQQLTRNVYLTHEVSLERKAKEMLISLKLTKKYTKQEIMEFYCNDICFANAFYGIQAASKGYFDKDVKDLSLSQIAYLCAIPNSPEYYNPYNDPTRALDRRDKILKDMFNAAFITEDQYNKAIKEKIKIKKPKYKFNDYMTTYAIDCATRYIMQEDGFEFKYKFDNTKQYNKYYKQYTKAYDKAKNELYNGGYKIYTSLDSNAQKKLQKVLNEQLKFSKEKDKNTGAYALQGAITAFDNKTGKVIAVVGGRKQKDESKTYSLNRAYQGYRQPGSTIKPLAVYTPALIDGYTPDTIVHNIDVSVAKRKGVDAQKLGGTAMTLRSALEQSKNGVAWQIFDKLGPTKALSYMNEMKFSKICPDDYYDSSSLGGLTHGVSTVEMAGAYATLVNHGVYREATCITSIIDREGNELYESADEVQVYDSNAADTMVDMMKGVLTNGTAKGLNWYGSTDTIAACKTGTTNGSKDGWLCGFTPYYTVTVWVGYDTPKTLNNLYGATYPGQIWKESMLELIKDKDTARDFWSTGDNKKKNNDEIEIPTTIPEYAYNDYMPGRKDEEVLSPGYTVKNFRMDRVIGEQVDKVINKMKELDKNSETYNDDLDKLYNQGCEIIKNIYSVKYTAEMQAKLNEAYQKYKN